MSNKFSNYHQLIRHHSCRSKNVFVVLFEIKKKDRTGVSSPRLYYFFLLFSIRMCVYNVCCYINSWLLQMLETDKNMNNTRGNEFNVFHFHHPFCAFHKSTIYKFTFRIKQSVISYFFVISTAFTVDLSDCMSFGRSGQHENQY